MENHLIIKQLLEDLQKAIKDKNSAQAHGVYDDIMLEIAFEHEPEFLDKLHILLKDTELWYA